MRIWPLLTALSLALAGCSAGQDKAAAEAGVQSFREMLGAGRYAEIYRAAGHEFRQTGSEESAVRFLQSVRERLGAVRSANQTGWRVNYGNGGSVTVLNYATEFERGRGTEEFVYRVDGGQPVLIGYHVNSNDLVQPLPPAGNATDGKPQ
jgi:hypothetical protein